ncbi:MAG TPA: hypothetical protein VN670_01360 [Acidobacteriaceae bacterium]|nr:hypothetical protein [Acidobacteriaceae bacterium]
MLVVTGSLPPEVCGVGDYVRALLSELNKKIDGASVFYKTDWSIRKLLPYARLIRKSGATVVNIQYPTEGYGYSIVPQLLCFAIWPLKRVITLHEYARKSLKGKLAIYLFFLSASWIIFTTEAERKAVCRVAPWIRKRSSVIPIGSNIPMQPEHVPEVDIVYFGQIRPQKGLEAFTSIVRSLREQKNVRVQVIGQISPGYQDYASAVLASIKELGIEVLLNNSSEGVSVLLSRARIALLPFPAGMSLRHGSALAAMGNGALLITRPSVGPPSEFSDICLTAQSTEELCQLTLHVLQNYDSYDGVRLSGQRFSMSVSWDNISTSYLNLIAQLGASTKIP